jgi:palmitoyltransferase
MSQSALPNGMSAGPPTQPAAKGGVATPKLNSQDMEMGNISGGDASPTQPDIMQLARVGDIAGMEKLFESSEYDATYTDGEGITPLHVRASRTSISPLLVLTLTLVVGCYQ